MGTNLPGYNPDALRWLEAHIDSWQADPAAIGLTDAQVLSLAVQITAARDAATNAVTKRQAAQDATQFSKETTDTLRQAAAPLVANIKHFAENAVDPSAVYVAASLLPRRPPAPVAPPGRATSLRAHLNGDGSISLTFESKGPVGTVWNVTRRCAGETAFVHVGFAAPSPKVFTDRTIPAGEKNVTYLVQGLRGSLVGPISSAATVYFGSVTPVQSEAGGTSKAA